MPACVDCNSPPYHLSFTLWGDGIKIAGQTVNCEAMRALVARRPSCVGVRKVQMNLQCLLVSSDGLR